MQCCIISDSDCLRFVFRREVFPEVDSEHGATPAYHLRHTARLGRRHTGVGGRHRRRGARWPRTVRATGYEHVSMYTIKYSHVSCENNL